MRRLVLVLVLAFGIAPAFAEPETAKPSSVGVRSAPDGSTELVIEQPRPYDSLSQKEREHELQAQQWQGPSGFWTSPHAAKHGAYRYRMMGIGAVLLLGMGLVTFRLIKRANAERSARG